MNKLFNGNIAVELDSVWNNVKKKQEAEVQKTNAGEQLEPEPEKEPEPEPESENESDDSASIVTGKQIGRAHV